VDISRSQIAQMIVVRASGHLLDHQREYPQWEPIEADLRYWLSDLNVGGVILLGGNAVEVAQRTKQLRSWSSQPLLIAADIEEGVGQRFNGATWFPPPMVLAEIAKEDEFKAICYAMQMGMITAQEALAIGINWLLAPVVDVNNNPDNPVINIRAFADTPEMVSKLTRAFIKGAQSLPVLATAKHFPGHGDTSSDSHLELPIIEHELERLNKVELAPFVSAISGKVASIMTAHLLIPALDQIYPATISQTIIKQQLRESLGYQGLIVTDALIMGGIANFCPADELAVKAIEAGVDMLLMPEDPELAIDAIYKALQSGRLDPKDVGYSLERIAYAKSKLVPSEQEDLSTSLYKRDYQGLCHIILEKSMQVSLPTPPLINRAGENVIVVDDLLNCPYLNHNSPSIVVPRSFGYPLKLRAQSDIALTGSMILQIFIRGNPFRGSAGLTTQNKETYLKLIQNQSLQAVIIYGSPYVAQWFKSELPRDIPFIFSYGQNDLAQAMACEKLFAQVNPSESYKNDFTD